MRDGRGLPFEASSQPGIVRCAAALSAFEPLMQLTLLSSITRAAGRHSEPPSTVPGSWRDSAISQLDQLAASNEPRTGMARRRGATLWIGLLGGVAVLMLGLLLRPPDQEVAAPPVEAEPAPAPAAPAALTPPPAAAVPAPVPAVVSPSPEPVPALAPSPDLRADDAAPAAVHITPLPAPTAPRRVRAPARAQEPPARGAEPLGPSEAAPAPVADAPAPRAQAAAPVAPVLSRDVKSLCASSGFLGEQWCHSRECRKPEHQRDAVCERLREIDAARQQHSSER